MGTAELGTRLCALVLTCPSLWHLDPGGFQSSQPDPGEKLSRELLPLPTPPLKIEEQKIFDTWYTAETPPEAALRFAASSWLCLVILGIN